MNEKIKQHQNNQPEIRCPLISRIVVCDACGSPNFNVDISGLSRKKPYGRCDECGHIRGRISIPKYY